MHSRNHEREPSKEVASRVWLVECQDTRLAPVLVIHRQIQVLQRSSASMRKEWAFVFTENCGIHKSGRNERPGDEPGDVLKSW